MNPVCFIIGGCRSGKSGYALECATRMPGLRKLFVATCRPADDEMRTRVHRHQQHRSQAWQTLEVPLALAETLQAQELHQDVILVDCLTLWVSNLMEKSGAKAHDHRVEQQIEKLAARLEAVRCPVFVVSNEIGAGIVPQNGLARRYRDLVGLANQRVAAVAGRVVWTVAGIPVPVKGDLP